MVHLHENVTAVSFFDDNRIIVGFDTGRVRVYDANLSRILYEFKIRSAPVLRIKRVPRTILCKDTQHHQHEEIWYLHEDRVVVAHTSKALDMETGRSHHRRDEEEVIDHNSWELRSDQQNIQDFSVRQSNLFLMLPLENQIAIKKKITPTQVHVPKQSELFEMTPPSHAVVIAAGCNPPLARYEGLKADNSNVGLTALAKAVVGKLTSSVKKSASNWIPSWAPIQMKKRESSEQVVIRRVHSKCTVRDPSRQIERVFVDPSNTLMATADTLGRVLVMEMETMQVIRMFKGYRDAQCAWIRMDITCDDDDEEEEDEEKEQSSPKLRRRRSSAGSFMDSLDRCPYLGLYLVIYTPHRDVVELWRMRSGPRVDAIVRSFNHYPLICISRENRSNTKRSNTGTKILNALSSLYVECTHIFDKK